MIAALLVAAPSAQGAFPGTNGKIAFMDASSPASPRIHVINPDGSAEVDISSAEPPSGDFSPAWSPDGRNLAFGSNRDHIFFEIYTMNADGSSVNRITNNSRVERSPSWSGDGTKLVYSGQCDRLSGLCVTNADASGETMRIPNTSGRSVAPAWSPDGGKIAFVRIGEGGGDNIYTINPDGSGLAQLTFLPEHCPLNTPCSNVGPPDWSPDGSKLVFSIVTLSCDPGCAHKADIYVVNRDGTGLAALTSVPFNEANIDPVWSPDGHWIAFSNGCPLITCPTDPEFDLYVMSSSGTDVRRLTHDREVEFSPDWQPAFKNSTKFCRTERARLGDGAFRQRYGTNKNGSNAFGKCVSARR